MKTADCGQFDDAPAANRLCDSGMRRLLAKAEMCPRSVVIFHVLRQNPSEMPRAPRRSANLHFAKTRSAGSQPIRSV